MPDYTIPPSQLPEDAKVTYGFTLDGDRIPLTVSYNTEAGPRKTVNMKWTLDGDRVPETGYTPDGDFNFPGRKWYF
jgi:hypothetical protein